MTPLDRIEGVNLTVKCTSVADTIERQLASYDYIPRAVPLEGSNEAWTWTYKRLLRVCKRLRWSVHRKMEGPYHGLHFTNGEIWIAPELSDKQACATLIHEMAEKGTRLHEFEQADCEVAAGLATAIVGRVLGLNTTPWTFGYICRHGGMAAVRGMKWEAIEAAVWLLAQVRG